MIKKYSPIAGLSIEQALINAVKMAREENTMVMAVLNDIVMCIDKNSSAVKMLKEYYQKLYIKHFVENMRRIKQK